MSRCVLLGLVAFPLLSGADTCIVSGVLARSPSSADARNIPLDTRVSSAVARSVPRFDSLVWSRGDGSLPSFDSTRRMPLVVIIR